MKRKICPYCNIEIRKKTHLLKCRPDINIKESYSLMIEKSYNCKSKNVIDDYVSGDSLPDIKSKYNLPYSITIELLNLNDLKTRSLSDSYNEKRVNKFKETCKKKFGVDNPSKNNEIKEKKKETFIKNYGVDNIFKRDGFSNYVSNILLKKYGKKRINNPEKISEIRLNFSDEKWEEIQNKTRRTIQERYGNSSENIWNKYVSNIEKKIETVLNENEIKFKPQKFVGGRSYDFHIINTNILIEVNGDYWHANPDHYDVNENINYAGKGMISVKEIWDRDNNKMKIANKYGYVVIILWETDIIYHDKNDTLNEYILNKISK
jgi:very-short-patch-repair endonuclease